MPIDDPFFVEHDIIFVDAIERKSQQQRRVRIPLSIVKIASEGQCCVRKAFALQRTALKDWQKTAASMHGLLQTEIKGCEFPVASQSRSLPQI